MKKFLAVLFAAALMLLVVSCATSVKRIETGTAGDLTGDWNENDVRIVCEALLDDCLNSPVFLKYAMEKGDLPVIRVGKFTNQSHEHIDTSIITTQMENAIMRSGKAYFAAEREFMEDINEEVKYGLENSSPETMVSPGNQTGVDFLLQGSVKTIVQPGEKKQVKTYYVTAQLTNTTTAVMAWQGFNDTISKYIKEPSVRP